MAADDPLALEPEDDPDALVTVEAPVGPHVFGGLLLAQALRAASTTVDGRPPCSMHASFVVAGAGGDPIRYAVERTRDGSSFSTRRVVASQPHGTVLVATVDFHADEPGAEYEAEPNVADPPAPEHLAAGRYDSPMFDSRDVPPAGERPHARLAWFRARPVLADDDAVHQQWLTMLTDFGPTRAAREPHAHLADEARRMSVSLDHSVWFHRPARVDEWVLSEIVPVSTGRGRGLAIGTVRNADGAVAATFAQEVLLRQRH